MEDDKYFQASTVSVIIDNLNFDNKFINESDNDNIHDSKHLKSAKNYWALLALILVFGTAAGNILVCLAIAWERRLQNVTNYFLMSLAITDLMVAILVMPLGILTLVHGYFPLGSEHCLVWICLDVLFCTASIMHLCTISVDRYLSLRYPMRFGRNKTRRRVTLKIIFVWLLSIAMSLPLSLMYSKDHSSVLVNGTCQIPDPVYKLVGSIVCFYIPLGVMLLTYYLTVRLLARQSQNLGGSNHQATGWASGWLGQTHGIERRCTWRRFLKANNVSTPNHPHSATSTDTELSTLDTHELWLPDSSIPEPTPSTMTALHQFGAEMLKLSRGLETVGSTLTESKPEILKFVNNHDQNINSLQNQQRSNLERKLLLNRRSSKSPTSLKHIPNSIRKRRASTSYSEQCLHTPLSSTSEFRKRFYSLPRNVLQQPQLSINNEIIINEENQSRKYETIKKVCYDKNHYLNSNKDDYLKLPPPCTCPYFGDRSTNNNNRMKQTEVKIISTTFRPLTTTTTTNSDILPENSSSIITTTTANDETLTTTSNATGLSSKSQEQSPEFLPIPIVPSVRKLSYSKTTSVVTWNASRSKRRGSSFGGVKTSLLLTPTNITTHPTPLQRSATLRNHNNMNYINNDNNCLKTIKTPSSPCLLQRNATVRSHHSRNSSVISRNSSRHGRIIRLEQKATKVLGVVFFTFVILWAPFFVLNLLPTVCEECEDNISNWVFDIVTWLGYASSMVNPIFYTIFNKVFRQAFKKVLLCKYSNKSGWR